MQKNGDIAGIQGPPEVASSSRDKNTPFQDLAYCLTRIVELASDVRTKRESTDDDDIKEYYDDILDRLRETAEMVLSGLSMELDEAKSSAEQED